MLRLKLLRIKGHRGVVNGPDLHFNTGGLLMCGGNGTGKSSFVDAIEKVLTDKCGSLDTGDMGVSWNKQGTHIKCAAPEVQLVLTDGNTDTTLTLAGTVGTAGSGVKEFLAAAKQKSFLLRRRDLLDFIITKPVDRYRAIQGFLKLDSYVAFENGLKELLQQGQQRERNAISRRSEHERNLLVKLNLSSGTPVNEDNCRAHLNSVLVAAGASPIVDLSEINNRLEEVETLLGTFSNMEAYQKLHQLRQIAVEIPTPSLVSKCVEAFATAATLRREEESRLKGHFYAEVMKLGLQWIREDELDRCPLCDNEIDRQVVEDHVVRGLNTNESLISLRNVEAAAARELRNTIRKYSEAIERVSASWKTGTAADFPEAAATVAEHLRGALTACKEIAQDTVIGDFDVVRTLDLDQSRQALIDSIDANLRLFPDVDRYGRLLEAKGSLIAVRTHLAGITQEATEADRLSRVNAQLAKLGEHAEQARKTVVQKLVDRITVLTDEYYQRIHPSEQIGKPTLVVPARGSGSLDLSCTFYSKQGDPRGYYSEGHLDSLGLCLFLAIRRLHHTQRPELALLILDDVLGTVDGDHRRATAELIFEKFKDHQIFITTHDRLWFEKLKAASQSSKCKHVLIADWSLDGGPVWGDHLSDYEWLTSPEAVKAKPADQVIKAGRLLEEMLQNLCSGMEVSIPFRIRGDYMIDSLWVNFHQAAKKKNAGFIQIAGTHLQNIEKLRSLRNWVGAHWNEWAQQLTTAEAQEFVEAVVGLRRCVYCEQCRQFIMRIAQLEGVWACKGEHMRYDNAAKIAVAGSGTPNGTERN